MAERIPVLLDTDIGSDIDDAVALAYLLRQPRCELLGITTVTGNVAQRAACAQVLCEEVGRKDIPIHLGASKAMLFGRGQPQVPQYPGIRHRPHRLDWPANTAVDFLRKTIRSRPGEITLLSIGPLTNVGLLFAVDPEIPSMLKQLVSMAGIFYGTEPDREWNALVDPIATGIVYAARPPRQVSIGLDVTMQCRMPADDVRQRFTPSPLNVVLEMAEEWFRNQKQTHITFHDPLAAAVLFKPELCGYENGLVRVSLETDEKRYGRTSFSTAPGEPTPHRVAKTVNAPGFFDEYFGVF